VCLCVCVCVRVCVCVSVCVCVCLTRVRCGFPVVVYFLTLSLSCYDCRSNFVRSERSHLRRKAMVPHQSRSSAVSTQRPKHICKMTMMRRQPSRKIIFECVTMPAGTAASTRWLGWLKMCQCFGSRCVVASIALAACKEFATAT
jgi:hypothetical protein